MSIIMDQLDLNQKWEAGGVVLARMHLKNIPNETDLPYERETDGWELSIRATRPPYEAQELQNLCYRMARSKKPTKQGMPPQVEIVEFAGIRDTTKTPFGQYFVQLEKLMLNSGFGIRRLNQYRFSGEPEVRFEISDAYNFNIWFECDAKRGNGDTVKVEVFHHQNSRDWSDEEEDDEEETEEETSEHTELLDVVGCPTFHTEEDNEEAPDDNMSYSSYSSYRIRRGDTVENLTNLLMDETPYEWLCLYLEADQRMKEEMLEFLEGEEAKGDRAMMTEKELRRLHRITDYNGMQWRHSFPND